jgi:protein-S-isoprenylcysteine O-methyltransferase Ste14
MALMPAFEIGVWNAWIFLVPMLIMSFFDMRVTAARESGKSGDFQLTRKEKRIINAIFLPLVGSFIYAIFLPLRLGEAWLYSGLVIYLLGVAFSIAAILNFATSPKDRVIAKGLYSISRNPMYIGLILMQVGLGISCSSWLYLLLTLVLLILLNENLSAEERYCLHRYGDSYPEYVNRTPRWIGIPKAGTKSEQGK